MPRGDVGGGLEIPDLSLPELVMAGVGTLDDKPAIIDGPSGRTLTYAELGRGVGAVARSLLSRGVGAGDVVALYLPNLPEFALAFHGSAAAGAVVTPANPTLTAGELKGQLRDSEARLLITVPGRVDTARAAIDGSGVEEIFVVGEAEGATPFATLLEAGGGGTTWDGLPEGVDIDPAVDLVALPYSSGTTGLPKGVMLTHRNLVANVVQCAVRDPADADEVCLAVLPFFHIYGLNAVLNLGLHYGATQVTMPRFEMEVFLECLEGYRVTRASLVPPLVLALARHPQVEEHDLSALERIISGAAPLSAELAEACSRRVGAGVFQGYGLTETSPVTHLNPPSRPELNRPGTVGPPVPDTEAKIVDVDSHEELGPGERGEIRVRGPQVMVGYLNAPEDTDRAFDDEGWLRTGDVGFVDEDGYLTVVDRFKELIKVSGYSVAPAELEAALVAHPSVADVAVVGVPDEERGEIPKAFVVATDPAADPEATNAELAAWLADRLAPYKRVREFEMVDEIPKSASGKILRRVLAERDRRRRGGEDAGVEGAGTGTGRS